MRTPRLAAAAAVAAALLLPAAAEAQPACEFRSLADYVTDPFSDCTLGDRLRVSLFHLHTEGSAFDPAAWGVIPYATPTGVGFSIGSPTATIVASSALPGTGDRQFFQFSFVGESLTGDPVTAITIDVGTGGTVITPGNGWIATSQAIASELESGGRAAISAFTFNVPPVGATRSCSVGSTPVPCPLGHALRAELPTSRTFVHPYLMQLSTVVDGGGPTDPGVEVLVTTYGMKIELAIAAPTVSAVPEPATAWLLGGGLAAFGAVARRRRGTR